MFGWTRRESFMYTEEDIRGLCREEITFLRAKRVLAGGKVQEIQTEESEDGQDACYIEADVDGSNGETYYVWIRYNENLDEIEDYECECEAYRNYEGMCKHCAATALKYLKETQAEKRMSSYRDSVVRNARSHSDQEIVDLVSDYDRRRRQQEQAANGTIEIEATLHESGWNYYYGRKRYVLTFQIGPQDGKKYVLKNLERFCEAVNQEEEYAYGKKLAFIHSKSAFTARGWEYAKLIQCGVQMNAGLQNDTAKELTLNRVTMEQFLNLNLGRIIAYEGSGYRSRELQILDEDPPLKLKLTEEENQFWLQLPPLTLWKGNEDLFVRKGGAVYRCSKAYREAAERVLECAATDRETKLRIIKSDMMSFCSAVLPELQKTKLLDTDKLQLERYQPPKAEIAYYLDEEDGLVTAKAECVYAGKKLVLTQEKKESYSAAFRDRMKEQRALQVLRAYFPYQDTERGQLFFDALDDARLYQLMNTGIYQLEQEGKVYATDRIKAHRIVRNAKTQVKISIKSGLLELSTDSEEFSKEELAQILDAYQKKKVYYRLKNGDFLNLKESSISALSELSEGLGLTGKKSMADAAVPIYSAYYVDSMLRPWMDQIQIHSCEAYETMLKELQHVEDSQYQVPEQLKETMREYQKTGYRWMRTLAHLGFGGILADDMGLGKTIQTIALLQARRDEGESKGQDLIICPASLIYNWKKELERFAPNLSVRLITGNAAQREELLLQEKEQQCSDVLLTSYDLVKRDLSHYKGMKFDTEIIDEAQNIKNQGTAAAKAVKKIQSSVRFALTGTPIENRLGELWSIFDYLLPGYLGSYEKFRKNYERPIMLQNEEAATQRLKKKVSPFLLRRVKNEVLKELPEKLEQVIYTKMEEEQKTLYSAYAQELREMLTGQSAEEVKNEKIEILARLTRLRQICCGPNLVYENYKGGSCKLETCMELIHEAIEGKHKVLLFSQFTSLFPMIQKRLREEGIDSYELTGSTPKEERQRLTEAFNQDEVPVFLISLKAGGTGLNLTAASVVIHFDPWWNVAAQNQASDRAHRIGQQNQVVVFQLIAQDSIEEKIIGLQKKKEKMANEILEGEGISAASLTREELLEILSE